MKLERMTAYAKSLSTTQWIGLVVSLLWVLGQIYYQYSDADVNAQNSARLSYEGCLLEQQRTQALDLTTCELKRAKTYTLWMGNTWETAFVVALLPLPFAWLYGFICITLMRIFTAGARQLINLKSLNLPKRLFGYFCYFVCVATFLMGLLASMRIYVDYQVPTYIGFDKKIFSSGNDYINAEGTWKSSEDEFPKIGNSRLQTSKIICHRDNKKCFESQSSILRTKSGKPHLQSDLLEFEIFSWTTNSVVYGSKNICHDLIYTIDLNSKTVNGVAAFVDHSGVKGYCPQSKDNPKPTTYTLVDGYSVFKDEQMKARPWLMRVMFSVLGS